jgi:hypothetical protein
MGGQKVQETSSLNTGTKLQWIHCIPHTRKVEMKAAALNLAGLKLKKFGTGMKYFTVPATQLFNIPMFYFSLHVSTLITGSSSGHTVLKNINLLRCYAYNILNLGPCSYFHILDVLQIWS